jgi:8-oxo-dGTP pyrophosphatase MutT (NUDIX family)
MISKDKPENFRPEFEVVSCFAQRQDEILLLLRQDHKPQPNTFGVPAGKIAKGETPIQAMQREFREETQIELDDPVYIDKVFVRYPDYDFIYHMFAKRFQEKPEVMINKKEHK